MMKILIPLVMILVGAGAGIGAGLTLKPAPKENAAEAVLECTCDDDAKLLHVDDIKPKPEKEESDQPDHIAFEYVKLDNQFIVPIIRDEQVTAIVIIALTLEVDAGTTGPVYTLEPKLRDSFLQALFDHSSIGGFSGSFANTENLLRLRRSLLETAIKIIGPNVNDVLVTDIARQDN
jgi:flagellar FliL protein